MSPEPTAAHVSRRRTGIGIDTGGTFTDAVAVDLGTGELLGKAKRPTTRQDLSIGVREALSALDASLFDGVELVSLSSTLATNAVVEGKGSRVGLIIAVPDPKTFTVPPGLPATRVAVVAGAHLPDGSVRTPLDAEAARSAIASMSEDVDAFAVSGYFSVANSEFELDIKRMVAEVCSAPVVCGYELSQQIGMVERASTAALNARLLPLVSDLLDAVRRTMSSLGIDAPLMVVKGDGSLTAEKIARDRPVDTVLSGPAASVVGACRLSGLNDALVADMGGTTTDIAFVTGGLPEVNAQGALVGDWRTRVQALDVRTVGLGGDSRIRVTREGALTIGPDRAIPLSIAVSRWSSIADDLDGLARQCETRYTELEPLFLSLVRRPSRQRSAVADELFDLLDGRAVHISRAVAAAGPFLDVEALVAEGFIAEIAVTPTDILAIEGTIDAATAPVASRGMELLARRARMPVDRLLGEMRGLVAHRLALEVSARALAEDLAAAECARSGARGTSEPTAADIALLSHLLAGGRDGALRSRFELGVPLVAVGAPVAAWFPSAAEVFGCQLVIPDHAEVANAFGALAGRVLERSVARVKADSDESFLVITPTVRERRADATAARALAEELASTAATAAARAAGAENVSVSISTDEVIARQPGSNDDVTVEMTVIATAASSPFVR